MLQGDVLLRTFQTGKETTQHGKGRALLGKRACFLLQPYMVFLQTPSCYWYAQELALLRLSEKHPDNLLSWLLPFKMIFGCDSFKKTHRSLGGKEAESFSCPSLKFSQIPKKWCTWSFDNSVCTPNWLQKLTKRPKCQLKVTFTPNMNLFPMKQVSTAWTNALVDDSVFVSPDSWLKSWMYLE